MIDGTKPIIEMDEMTFNLMTKQMAQQYAVWLLEHRDEVREIVAGTHKVYVVADKKSTEWLEDFLKRASNFPSPAWGDSITRLECNPIRRRGTSTTIDTPKMTTADKIEAHVQSIVDLLAENDGVIAFKIQVRTSDGKVLMYSVGEINE